MSIATTLYNALNLVGHCKQMYNNFNPSENEIDLRQSHTMNALTEIGRGLNESMRTLGTETKKTPLQIKAILENVNTDLKEIKKEISNLETYSKNRFFFERKLWIFGNQERKELFADLALAKKTVSSLEKKLQSEKKQNDTLCAPTKRNNLLFGIGTNLKVVTEILREEPTNSKERAIQLKFAEAKLNANKKILNKLEAETRTRFFYERKFSFFGNKESVIFFGNVNQTKKLISNCEKQLKKDKVANTLLEKVEQAAYFDLQSKKIDKDLNEIRHTQEVVLPEGKRRVDVKCNLKETREQIKNVKEKITQFSGEIKKAESKAKSDFFWNREWFVFGSKARKDFFAASTKAKTAISAQKNCLKKKEDFQAKAVKLYKEGKKAHAAAVEFGFTNPTSVSLTR